MTLNRDIYGAIACLQSPSYRAEVYIAIAEQFNLLDESDKALECIDRALQEINLIAGEDIFALRCKVSQQLAQAGCHARAIAILTELLEYADKLEDSDCRDYGLRDVAMVYAEMGMYDKAIEIGLMLEDSFRMVAHLFNEIAYLAAIERCQHEQILNIFAAIEHRGETDYFLLDVIKNYLAKDELERAIALVHLMHYPVNKVGALTTITQKLGQTTSWAGISDFIHQSEVYALAEADPAMKAQALKGIAEQYIEIDRLHHARRVLQQAQQLAISASCSDIQAQIYRDMLLSSIARTFAKSDDEEAMQATDAMSDRLFALSTLSDLATRELEKAKYNNKLKIKLIESLSAAEAALAGDSSDLADAKRVSLAESWSKLGMCDRIEAIAQQINDPSYKGLALTYAGIDILKTKYNPVAIFSQACEAASAQTDVHRGMKILTSLFEQIALLAEWDRAYILIEVVRAYFQLLGQDGVSKEEFL